MQNHHKELNHKEIKEYVCERFENVKKSNKAKNLVEFQTMNKFSGYFPWLNKVFETST